ncbi:zinc finger protein 425-like [Lutzomyia longipalpis]|uniref:zinc finger protein 425-like n=1 Tax=Lutzomyia longipalpis TaxID=7200 RepID=UPI002483A34D|nr:zinc finger protein 425-like [Lutzomyia longipalpis]
MKVIQKKNNAAKRVKDDRQKEVKGVQKKKNHHDWSSSSDISQEDNVEAEKRRSFRCESCSRSFIRFFELTKHKKRHHGVEIYGSPEKTTTKTFGFDQQDKGSSQLRTQSEDFQCSICSKTFTKKWGLRLHEKIHGEKIFKCAICQKTFPAKNYLAIHLKSHSKKNLECQECGKTFQTNYGLKRHAKIHSEEKPHICSICGKEFKIKFYLKRHLKLHETHRKSFECALCGQKFLWKISIRRHLAMHITEGKKFFIHGKFFKNKADMQRYLRGYSLTRNFQCDRCPKTYIHKRNFRRHKLLIHEKKAFTCGVCGKKLTRKYILNKHMQLHDKNRKI